MKIKLLLFVCLIGLSLQSCTRVGPGYAGIKVSMAGNDKGVNDIPYSTGWIFYNPLASDVYEYPTFVQTAVWTKSIDEGRAVNEEITFTNADQMQISADISLAYHLDIKKVPAFYVKFRNDNLELFTHGYLRNLAREEFDKAAGKYSIENIMGNNANFLNDVRTSLQAHLTPIGVELDQFGFIGAPRPPQAVIEAINAKVHATQLAQQKQNELVQTQADAAKQIAKAEGNAKSLIIQAEADATANKLRQASLTPLLVQQQFLEKWNGVLPIYSSAPQLFKDITK